MIKVRLDPKGKYELIGKEIEMEIKEELCKEKEQKDKEKKDAKKQVAH